jgi:hypothetical protein
MIAIVLVMMSRKDKLYLLETRFFISPFQYQPALGGIEYASQVIVQSLMTENNCGQLCFVQILLQP